jgi:hypothetical protein
VNSYCQCRPGYTGDRCDGRPPNPCDPEDCRINNANTVCNNEDRCVCRPGFTGDDCVDPTTRRCINITITVGRNDLTAEVIRIALAAYIQIDISNIEVFGPFPVPNDDTRVRYLIRICGDDNINENNAGDNFIDKVEGGDDGNLGIESAEAGDTTGVGADSGSAVQLGVSLLLFLPALI